MQNTPMNEPVYSSQSLIPDLPVDSRVAALLAIEGRVDRGCKISDAVAQVAMETGIGVRTLFSYRSKTNFIPRTEWASVLSPKWNPGRGMKATCHPDAIGFFLGSCRAGNGVSESYRRMVDQARSKGWEPISTERTLRRELDRKVTAAEIRRGRRDALPPSSGDDKP